MRFSFCTAGKPQALRAVFGVLGILALHLCLLWGASTHDMPGLAPEPTLVWHTPVPLVVPVPPPRPPQKPASASQPAPTPTPETVTTPEEAVMPAPAPAAPEPVPMTAPVDVPAADLAPLPDTTTPGHHPQWPPSGRWEYEVHAQSQGLNYPAQATLQWHTNPHHPGSYQAEWEWRALWLRRSQRSSGGLGPLGLRPLQFVEQGKQSRRLDFDWADTPAGGGQALASGTQDRLSVVFQLGWLLQAGPSPASGQAWDLPVLGHKGSETWRFVVRGLTSVQVPAGTFSVWHVVRQAPPTTALNLELWLAPALGFLPVRLRLQQDNGDLLEQTLSRTPSQQNPSPQSATIER